MRSPICLCPTPLYLLFLLLHSKYPKLLLPPLHQLLPLLLPLLLPPTTISVITHHRNPYHQLTTRPILTIQIRTATLLPPHTTRHHSIPLLMLPLSLLPTLPSTLPPLLLTPSHLSHHPCCGQWCPHSQPHGTTGPIRIRITLTHKTLPLLPPPPLATDAPLITPVLPHHPMEDPITRTPTIPQKEGATNLPRTTRPFPLRRLRSSLRI